MRPRKKQRNLPQCMYLKHGKYYLVKANKWSLLGATLEEALLAYAREQSPEKMMMPELINKVVAQISTTAKQSTIKQYQSIASQLCAIFVEFSPSQVNSRHIAELKQSYSDRPSQGNQALSLIKQVFQFALEWGLVNSNPVIGIRRHKESARTRYITDDEFHALLDNADLELRTIMTLCFLTGQRINDVLSIKKADISEDGIQFVQQKTGQRVFLAMSNDIKQTLEVIPPSKGLLLLANKQGEPLNYKTIQARFMRLTKRLNIEDVHLHDIRAKSLTEANRQGKNAQALGGHATESMTQRYIRSRDTITAEPPSIRQKN